MLFTFPLMVAIQEISGRIGCVTGRGIAENLRRHYSPWLVRVIVVLLLVANTINIGADLGAMGAALKLLIGGPLLLYTAIFGIVCVLAEIFISYQAYARTLKWLTIVLFSYVAVVFSVHLPWREALHATFVPHITLTSANAMALVAVLGTTISPYLFFWQSSLEVQDRNRKGVGGLCLSSSEAKPELKRIRLDTIIGMAVSNVIAVFIIFATAATLHAHGVTTIQTSSQAAEALRPIAGRFTFVIFAAGIIGTGLLAVPVLAGSGAYALAETFRWKEGLDQKFEKARYFYSAIAVATLVGVALNFMHLDPVKALYWSAVVNGVLAAPVMAVIMLIADNGKIMQGLTLSPAMRLLGWLATLVMVVASVAFFALGAGS
jgi:Mn2+/Fe2+ NRAMP family transporter